MSLLTRALTTTQPEIAILTNLNVEWLLYLQQYL